MPQGQGDGTAHFGLALNHDPKACTTGYGGTKRISPNQTTNLPPVNARASCTLPPGSPSSVRGAQNAPAAGGTGARGATAGSGSSYPLALSRTPVPLGSPAVNSDRAQSAPVISMPTAPAGATGPAHWIWLMTGATR